MSSAPVDVQQRGSVSSSSSPQGSPSLPLEVAPPSFKEEDRLLSAAVDPQAKHPFNFSPVSGTQRTASWVHGSFQDPPPWSCESAISSRSSTFPLLAPKLSMAPSISSVLYHQVPDRECNASLATTSAAGTSSTATTFATARIKASSISQAPSIATIPFQVLCAPGTPKGLLSIDTEINLLSSVLKHDPFNCPIRRTTQVWERIAEEQGIRARTCARRYDNIIQASIAGRDRSVGTEGQIATKKRLLEQLFVMMNQPQALVRMQKKRRYRSEEADRALLLETIRLNPFAQKIGQVAKAWEDVRDALGMKVHPRQCIRRVHRMIRPFQLRERMYRGHIPEEMREVNDDLVKQVLHLMRQGGHSSALEDDGDHWNDDDSGSGVSDTDDQDDVSMTLATPERLSQDDSLYDMSSTPAQHPVATHHHTDGGIAIDVSKSPDLPIGTKVIPSPIYDYGYPRSESPPTMERMLQLYGAILHEFHVVREYMSRIDRQRQRDKDNQKVMYRTMQELQQQVQEQQWFIQGLERRIQHQQSYQSASSSSYQNDNSISKHHGRPSDEYVAPPTTLRGNEESYVTQERDAFEISHFTSAKSYEHRSRSNATKSRH